MNSPTLTAPPAKNMTGSTERVICVALRLTAELTDPAAVAANLWGAHVMERCLVHALRAAAATLLQSGTANPALSRGVFCFFVPEVQPALAAIVAELRELGLEAYSVVGVFDRAEDYWRAAHPPKPIFDIHARMMEVMPLCPPGEKPTPGPHPEMVRIMESIKRAIHPLPDLPPRRPLDPPAAPATE